MSPNEEGLSTGSDGSNANVHVHANVNADATTTDIAVGIHKSSSAELLQDSALNVRHAVPRSSNDVRDTMKKFSDWQKKTGVSCVTKFSDAREVLDGFLPCLRWMRSYDIQSYLMQDIIAGFTVGVMIIPQVCLDFSC